MTVLGWIVLAVVIGWLFLQRSAIRDLRRQIESTRQDVYRGQYEAQERMQTIRRELKLARLEAREARGELQVGPHTTVGEAMELHPQVAGILSQFHISGRGVDPNETLAAAAEYHAQDLEDILVAISAYLEGGTPPQGIFGTAPPAGERFDV